MPYNYFTTGNYGLRTCPNNEYIFVAEPQLLRWQDEKTAQHYVAGMRQKSGSWPSTDPDSTTTWQAEDACCFDLFPPTEVMQGANIVDSKLQEVQDFAEKKSLRKPRHPFKDLVKGMWDTHLPECLTAHLDLGVWTPTREFKALAQRWQPDGEPSDTLLACIIALRLYAVGPSHVLRLQITIQALFDPCLYDVIFDEQ